MGGNRNKIGKERYKTEGGRDKMKRRRIGLEEEGREKKGREILHKLRRGVGRGC